VRILFIGGTRSVGIAAVRRLTALGHDLAVFHRGEHEGDLPPIVTHFRNPDAAMPVREIPDELRAFEPEIVVHMIAMGEADMTAAMTAFSGVARRIIVPSSGDVYRAYGILWRKEEGPPDPSALTEEAPLRSKLYPYRTEETRLGSLEFGYEKILVERVAASDAKLPATILRFPKIYGPGDNESLATVYGMRHHPDWRWTHGHAVNVGAAVALAATDDRAAGRIYNLGEEHTPTMGERLSRLPPNEAIQASALPLNFAQPLVMDSRRIRAELGYREVLDELQAMTAIAEAAAPA
jgi:nucleoside-diphosphate-sugar epimerase